ncbi:MAG: ATP-binding protein [Kofleriaceae bacterium]
MTAFEQQLALTFHQVVRARALAEQMSELADRTIAPPDRSTAMDRLAARVGMRREQIDLVWAIVACSIDARTMPHLEVLGGGHARRGLSIAVYAQFAALADEAVAELAQWLAAGNALVSLGLIEAAETGTSPAARAYVASPRLVAYLRGDDYELAPLRIVRAVDTIRDDAQRVIVDELRGAMSRASRAMLVVEGPLGSGRATAVAEAVGDVLVLDVSDVGSLREALATLQREALLRGLVPLVANIDQVVGEERRDERRLLGAFADAVDGPVVATSSVSGLDVGTRRSVVRVAWSAPSAEIREQLWRRGVASLGATCDETVSELAHRYRVGPAAIERAIGSVALTHRGPIVSSTELVRGLRHNIAERLRGLASRVEVTQTWDDLVLSDDIRDLVSALVGRVRHSQQVLDQWGFRKKIARGTGTAALFSGPPGTGKTMLAGLLAKELGLELYQVDLSKIVSKWVGETEKNLGRVFDAAEEGHGLLLFDEADSLFGARSNDPKSSNDRYANMEVNYLLQRVEAFGGITVLTTNLETAIDPALKRRLAAHIVFATPDEEERACLWERQLTTGSAPIARDVDVDDLARLFPKMSGANIRNAAIAAAFLAVGDGKRAIAQTHLIRAARAEYRSMGHVISDMARAASL